MSSLLLRDLNPLVSADLHSHMIQTLAQSHGSAKMLLKGPARSSHLFRSYLPGDAPSLIDWKAYARTDHLWIREKNIESKLKIAIAVKLSPSMSWPLPESGEKAKLELALRLACHLCHLHLRSGDAVILTFFDEAKNEITATYRLRSIAEVLSYFKFLSEEGFASERVSGYRLLKGNISTLDRLYYLSDLFEREGPAILTAKARSTIFLHTLSTRELDFAWTEANDCYFSVDGAKLEVKGSQLKRAQTHTLLENWLNSVKSRYEKRKYFLATDLTPIADYLTFLRKVA